MLKYVKLDQLLLSQGSEFVHSEFPKSSESYGSVC